jgi:hypothetical protein
VIARALFLLLCWAAAIQVHAQSKVELQALPDVPREIPGEPLPEVSPAVPSAPDDARIDRFVLEGPRFLKDSTRLSLKDVRALGPVRKEQVKKAPNLHDPLKVDEFRTFSFDGLDLYGFMGDQQEFWPIRVVVSSASWEIAESLAVGSPAARVEEVLGKPATRTPELWTYSGEIQNVNFHIRGERIIKIEFIYYLD